MTHEIEKHDSVAEYLRSCGLTVEERDDGNLKIRGSVMVKDGKAQRSYLIVDPEDVSDIIGDVYRANKDVEEVFEENVIERQFTPVEEESC